MTTYLLRRNGKTEFIDNFRKNLWLYHAAVDSIKVLERLQ